MIEQRQKGRGREGGRGTTSHKGDNNERYKTHSRKENRYDKGRYDE